MTKGLASFSQLVHRHLLQLNLSPSTPPTNNPQQLRRQYLSTRTFLITFSLSLLALLFYNATITSMATITFSNPTLTQYHQLHDLHSKTLTCPCSKISISDHVFVNISYARHQICDSFYTTSEWIFYLGSTDSYLMLKDFRNLGSLMFQGIQSLCELSQATIENSLEQLYSSHFVSALLVSEKLFRIEVNGLVEQFVASTTNTFALSLLTIRDITQANALLSAMLTNYELVAHTDSSYVAVGERKYDNGCDCRFSSQCTTQLRIDIDGSDTSAWFVPGFYYGCYILEGLRQSSLECLYNQSCLNELINHLPSHDWTDVTPLDPSTSSRFDANTPFGKIVDELLVDAWNWTITYDHYFDQCQPKECSYIVTQRNDVITIITTVISLTGGLMTALKLIMPIIINAVFYSFGRRKKQLIHPCRMRDARHDITVEQI